MPGARRHDGRWPADDRHQGAAGLAADLDRDGQAESFRSLEVDHQFKFGGLFDREVGGLRTLEDLVDVSGGTPPKIRSFKFDMRKVPHVKCRRFY
jgi:hypothetical protein